MSTKQHEAVERIFKQSKGASRDTLIPLLQKIQEAEGYLSKESISRLGRELGLPASKIFGVATFYNQFRFTPKGRHHFMVCRGTACHVKGSAKLLDELSNELGIEPGQTTRDRVFSLEAVACLGACGIAPVACVDGEFHSKVTPKRLDAIIKDCKAREA